MTPEMTRNEFFKLQRDAERRIRRRVIPHGIFYAVMLAMIEALIGLAIFLFFRPYTRYPPAACIPVLWAMGICTGVLLLCPFLLRRTHRKFLALAVRCPSCGFALVFGESNKTLSTGNCCHCGARVFD
jgi:hypothetical protein